MFTRSSRYSTLTQQVARNLEEQISQGVWRDSLPGERQLAETMQVSRRTIRAATEILRQKKLIRKEHGVSTRVLAAPAASPGRESMRTVGLLLPKPLEDLKPFTTAIDILRGLFYTNGYRLDTHFGQRYLSRRPASALTRLVAQFPNDGWILASANRACQAWFAAQGIPTIVAGTAHEGIALPSMDVDMQATARHAAQFLLRHGHRQIALLMEEADWAGHRRTEQGFLEGARQSGSGNARVFRHGGDVSSLQRLLARILQGAEPPTALFIVNPYHYLAVAAILATRGVRVPEDVSMLCRDDDVCLKYLPVTPSRYSCSAQTQAKQMYSMFIETMQSGTAKRAAKSVLMLPEFIPGNSVATRKL
jgi:DNA-binding LacI/PurR family transcriptional regulator